MTTLTTASKFVVFVAAFSMLPTEAFKPNLPSCFGSKCLQHRPKLFASLEQEADSPTASTSAPSAPPPVLNGKMVLPMRVALSGLSGHVVPAVYAVIRSGYTRGSDGWDKVEYVGRTTHLYETLQQFILEHGSDKVAHLRALSFSFPQEGAMQSVVDDWRESAVAAGALLKDWEPRLESTFVDMMVDEDDDDEWEIDEATSISTASKEELISPFANSGEVVAVGEVLEFTQFNVDKVLEEVRPYLISDGGNVSVEKVDPVSKEVFLKLEGACGSCPSSTVTMKMGIERVLKEHFPNVQVVQVEDESDKPTELTYAAVEQEVKRIQPAIVAMGGVVEIINVDPIGEVTLHFRGANKVRQGLEMALLDIPFCKHIKFVTA